MAYRTSRCSGWPYTEIHRATYIYVLVIVTKRSLGTHEPHEYLTMVIGPGPILTDDVAQGQACSTVCLGEYYPTSMSHILQPSHRRERHTPFGSRTRCYTPLATGYSPQPPEPYLSVNAFGAAWLFRLWSTERGNLGVKLASQPTGVEQNRCLYGFSSSDSSPP